MARKPYKPTKKHIETVRALKEKGATDKACYEAIGVSAHTWKKYQKVFFATPIKEGDEKRQETALEIYENSMDKQITGFMAPPEIDYEYKFNEQTEKYDWVPVRKRERYIPPNATLTMFGLANVSEGKYQSINKVENTVVNNNTNELPEINWTKPKTHRTRL